MDTRGLKDWHIGKRLRIELSSGQVEEVRALELTICEPPEACCGLTYRLLCTNRNSESKQVGSVHWVGFEDIENFQVLGDSLA
jgi:hypothetical protein